MKTQFSFLSSFDPTLLVCCGNDHLVWYPCENQLKKKYSKYQLLLYIYLEK